MPDCEHRWAWLCYRCGQPVTGIGGDADGGSTTTEPEVMTAPEEHGDAESAAKSQLQELVTDSDDLEGSSPPPVPSVYVAECSYRCGWKARYPVPGPALCPRCGKPNLQEFFPEGGDADDASRARPTSDMTAPEEHGDGHDGRHGERTRPSTEGRLDPPSPPPVPCDHRTTQCLRCGEQFGSLAGGSPVPSVDEQMARIIHEVVQGGPPPGATDSWWVTAAIRQALEEKREARADRDLHQREAIRALQRADQAEREREQYIKGGWYEEYQKRLDALLAENTELREALRRLAPYSSEEPTDD